MFLENLCNGEMLFHPASENCTFCIGQAVFAPLRNSVNVALSNDIIKYIIIQFSFLSSLVLKYACIKWLLTSLVQYVLSGADWPIGLTGQMPGGPLACKAVLGPFKLA